MVARKIDDLSAPARGHRIMPQGIKGFGEEMWRKIHIAARRDACLVVAQKDSSGGAAGPVRTENWHYWGGVVN